MSEQFPEYPKINSLWKRHKEGPDKGKVITDQFAQTEYGYLADLDWHWTEKVDGTNVRLGYFPHGILWNRHTALAGPQAGERLCSRPIGGRTDKTEFNGNLIERLQDIHWNLRYDAVFGDKSVVLYGEGYGAGIQGGGHYREDQGFVLFDVKVDGTWLDRLDVLQVADSLGLDVVKLVATTTIPDATAIVKGNYWTSAWDGVWIPEGLVGTPVVPLRDRYGNRIQTKIKWADVGQLG